jgi:hypothetical protein
MTLRNDAMPSGVEGQAEIGPVDLSFSVESHLVVAEH